MEQYQAYILSMWYIISLLIFLITFVSPSPSSADSCLDCHANRTKISEMGWPQLFITGDMVRDQSHMPASCTDCHLGNADASEKKEAHSGLLAARLVSPKFDVTARSDIKPDNLSSRDGLKPRGENRATRLLPKKVIEGRLREDPDSTLLLLHDKNPDTLAYNPVLSMKTCGRCHAETARKFLNSPMGGAKNAHTQSQYRAWTGPSGPQSCGLWVGALAQPEQERFAGDNMKYYNVHSTMQLSEQINHNNQRTCNKCHVGCLDCHLDIRAGQPGDNDSRAHTFVRKPPPLSCYGGGKAFICHAGPLERRRGDGYLRAEFTQAAKKGKQLLKERPDIHAQKGISCTDCHEPNPAAGTHADLKRTVSCSKCHSAVVKDHTSGPHRKVDCAACHTSLIGGYAFNFWTAVGPEGKENPLTRIQDYLTDATRPLLIKNPAGIWIPVHVVPHTSGNIRAEEVKLSRQLIFRNPPQVKVKRRYISNDSYAITGLAQNVDSKDRDVMVWLNIDRVAHATGRSRECRDCHESAEQRIIVKFEGGSYKDLGDGEYSIIADRQGLRVTDFKDSDTGKVPKDLSPFKEKWDLKGDFSLPEVRNRTLYKEMEDAYRKGMFNHRSGP